MMFARKAVFPGIDQHPAHDALQGVLNQEIVADQVFTGHMGALEKRKRDFVARCIRSRLTVNHKGVESVAEAESASRQFFRNDDVIFCRPCSRRS
ncbi:hypothetical protein MAE02_05260 [Microvirga aerophila]|uniref:Uncharacterized protein n=1 Tax=Microvirga aerophila TaxID=670291 RepID=A0A512BLJ1_9HYPH|nr:hypothetical protein MAE02_05260 [Microvirga aerophila]